MIGRIIGGKYSLEREIGRGGMGAIWIALDGQLRRRVALKLMRSDQLSSASSRSRFEREAMAVAQITNPHVVQVYDYGIDEESPYIVMELLEGEDLDARLSRHGRLPLAAVTTLVTQAAKALGTAHAAGIVHRDLKPANIFLARVEGDELVKILDFGVAAVASSVAGADMQATRAGTVLGTPHYMSPEQARSSKNLDHRSDLWSLAVVAYRAISGQHPFTGESLGDLIVKVCTDEFTPPSQIVTDLDPEVDRFFERALAKDPGQRFQSAKDFMNAFAALGGDGQHARPAKILVIDDEPDLALLIKQRFRQQIRKSIYEFVFAGDGQGALDQLRLHPDIDLALSDINMPGMDGLTFLERAAEIRPLLEVVMVSAYGDMTNIRSAMNRGAFDFLVKPIDFKDFEATITKTLKHVQEARKTARSNEENGLLRMFVGGALLDRLMLRGKAGDMLGTETVEATVAFIDVCGFGAAMAERPIESVMRMLNANFEIIVPEVVSRRGIVDKFLGDAALAVFRGDHHAEQAVDACVAIRAQLAALAERAGPESPYANGVSIGIDTGNVAVGSIGSRALARLDLTVLGSAVNAAAQLQGKAARGEILIGDAVFASVSATFDCEPAGVAQLAGHKEPVPIHRVLRKAESMEQTPMSDAKTVLMDGDEESVSLSNVRSGGDLSPSTETPSIDQSVISR
jgi:eukaryotic-like serine/threonine-protein kinase